MRIQTTWLLVGIMVALAGAEARTLEIGAPVPPLAVTEWMHGEGGEPAEPDGKTIHVVEFWATWCGPCLDSIPYLNDLWERYKDQDVVLLAITSEAKPRVEAFLEHTPIHYQIGFDAQNTTTAQWLGAGGGIPQVFVVDGNGILLWRGHPMGGLDYVLKKVVEGSYTQETALAVAEAEAVMQQAIARNDMVGIESAAAILLVLEPDNLNRHEFMVQVYVHLEREEELHAAIEAWRRVARESGNAMSLLDLAQTILGMGPRESHNPLLALEIMREALTISDSPSFTVLAGAAELYAQIGAPRRSLELLERARAGAEADSHTLADIEILSAFYKALVEIHDAQE